MATRGPTVALGPDPVASIISPDYAPPLPGDEDAVPTYTEIDEGDFFTAEWLSTASGSSSESTPPAAAAAAELPERFRALPLPLTTWPVHVYAGTTWPGYPALAFDPNLSPESRTQMQLINAFFTAIGSKNVELVTLMIRRGLVSPDVTAMDGCTPLISAVLAGNGAMVCTLVGLGASVNGYGSYESCERTPLMVAASRGNLALVRLLMDDFKADDGIIAPDGQLALRLAADRGHRDVVAFLPARRGGAWRRWKVHHDVATRRMRKAANGIYEFFKFFLWRVPKFFAWDVPKHVVVKPLIKSSKWAWENKHRFGGWCKRQVDEFPGRAKRAAKATWKGVKAVPKGVWHVMKEIPRVTKELLQLLWKVIKRIPAALKVVGVWIVESLKRVGQAVADVFLKAVSALHTALMAVLDFFRSITLKNVLDGFMAVFRAIFVDFPQAIWTGIKGLGKMTATVFLVLFGCTGQIIVWIFQGLWWVVQYVPKQLWKIITSIGSSIAKGYHEIMVWFNPKH
ncbi:hypothetical protein B0H63DRAFT_485461 [Podospora didyma]|uniref:Ankyrin n=1 Tax=Podospora didyma TaxID=330526 RepID=A0AAE0K9R5_9PEZI|nr:hypothetical protein B0H63DRAFT_485461 [Podospora didyma]